MKQHTHQDLKHTIKRGYRALPIAALLAISAAAWIPLPSMAQSGVSLVINTAPPAPRFESVPAARRGYVWAPGYWNWNGQRHVWIGGHWESARDGYQYRANEWVRDNGGYRLQSGGWYPVAQVQTRYDNIRVAPPAPRYERVPGARNGYVWQPGYWDWRGNRYEWVQGLWVADRPGYVYSRPQWIQRDGRWFFDQPRWSSRDGRDRDHDGVPDRFEHGRDRDRDGIPDRLEHNGRRDNDRDGIPNRRDHDRDGDGVPNYRDDRPDNPRRN
jgi:hypothetical protein